MKKFTPRSIFFTIMAGLGLMLQPCHMVAVTAGPTANAPQLSQEDLKFLEDLGKQIQKEVEQLPTREQLRAQGLPEDQVLKANTKEKFDEDVTRYSKMSEEELFAEMEKALAEVEKASTPETRPEYPSMDIYQGEEEAPKPAPAPAPKPSVPSNKQQAAIQLIDTLLASITNFLSKSQVIVELPGKIVSWIKEGKLRNWPTSLTWNAFRAQVEELQAKLNKIKDKDAKTGTYKYLDDLIKDEGTYNNLVKIKDALVKSEPKISAGNFGIDKMTSVSRQAVRDTLLSLHEAVATLAIPASLDKIIEKYEPTAKKLKESEEAAAKRALEESRRGRIPGQTTVGGYPKADRDYRGRYDFDRDGGRYSPGLFDAPAREKEKPLEDKKDANAGGKTDAKKPDDKKPSAEKPKREEDKRADELAKDFSSGLFQFLSVLDNDKNLTNIESHMKDASFVDESLYSESIPQAIQGISKSIFSLNGLKRRLKKKTLNDDQKKEFKKEIRDSYKEAKSEIDKISKQIESINKAGAAALVAGGAARSANDLFTKAKTFAYFGKKSEAELRTLVDADRKTVADATAAATTAGTPVPQNIITLDDQTKRLEALLALSRKDVADLAMLADKLKELNKLVGEF